MKSSIKLLTTIFALALVLVSCKDENSIQTYFVDHQELPEFLSLDVAANVIDFSNANLSKEEQEAYQSVRKLDVLAYKLSESNKGTYQQELDKAKAVFANNKYEELMEFKDKELNVKINAVGTGDTVDEFIILASSNDIGFTIVRVLGDDMRLEELLKLTDKMQNADVDKGQLKNLMEMFK